MDSPYKIAKIIVKSRKSLNFPLLCWYLSGSIDIYYLSIDKNPHTNKTIANN